MKMTGMVEECRQSDGKRVVRVQQTVAESVFLMVVMTTLASLTELTT